VKTNIQKAPNYRDDVQGLRAIGVLLVAIYHIWIGRVSGGVDVFFVVSGFLLIGSLSRELQSKNRVDLLAFLTRLIRRLLPAAFLVIVTIMATGWIWLPKVQWDSTIEHLAASTLYVENWLLALNSVDYLARETSGSPVQHYWAMSAQVQSLLLIGALLSMLGWTMRLFKKSLTNTGLLSFLAVIFAMSLTYSVITTANNQTFAYFDTFSRIWEFTAGGLVALILPKLSLNGTARVLLGWIGLTGILLCGILIEVSTLFPGYIALWPVTSAAMVLIAGSSQAPLLGANRLLSLKPLAWLGRISYSLYLWHWPLLVAYLTINYSTSPSLTAGITILLASIILAYITERYVERPFRKFTPIGRFKPVFGATICVGLIGTTLLIWNETKNSLIENELALEVNDDKYIGSRALDIDAFNPGSLPIHPGPLTAHKTMGKIYDLECGQSMSGREVKSCTFGDKSASFNMVILGGSHSAQWVPAFRKTLDDFPNWNLSVITKSACPLSTEAISEVPEYIQSCHHWNKLALQQIIDQKPDIVVILATRTTYPQTPSQEHVPEGYREQWKKLIENDITLIGLRDTPRLGFDVPLCVDVNGRSAPECMIARNQLLANENPAANLPEAEDLNLVDLSDRFCTSTVCPPVIGNILVYRDKGHISPPYMDTVSKALSEAITPIINRVSIGP